MNVYLNNLIKMINKINRIKKDDAKCEYIYQVLAYASFIYYSSYISTQELNDAIGKISIDSFNAKYQSERNNSIKQLISDNDLLDKLYCNTLSIYNNYELEKKDDSKIDKNIEKEFFNFLKYMNCYDLYQELDSKKMISHSSSVLNHSICINSRKDSYIILSERDDIYRYFAFAHEIAHAFENRILTNRKQYFDAPFKAEIMSITFNRLFMEYLKENNSLSLEEINLLKNNFEIDCFYYIKWSSLICKAIKNNSFLINNYDIDLLMKNQEITRSLTDHNYSLGSIFSLSLLDMWRKDDNEFIKNLPNIIFYIDKMSLKELIDVFNSDRIMKSEFDKTLIKK